MADVQSQAAFDGFDDAKLKGVHWLWSFIAGLGDYLDAGSIVAGGASLALWVKYFHLNPSIIGIIAAFSSNGISTAVGAFFAGRLGDRYGRKFIFMFDLLLYALGALVIIVSVNSAMLIIGYMIMGLAVGADVPTSWSLIAEFSPRKHRGKMMGITNIMWYVGPIVILLLSLAFAGLGIVGVRLVFASLLLVALVTWGLRFLLIESPRWTAVVRGDRKGVEDALNRLGESQAKVTVSAPRRGRFRDVFKHSKALWFITPIYVLWGIPAGTYGFFLPYIFRTLGAASAAQSDLLQIMWFASAIITVVVVFMPFNDRIDRRILYAISAGLCAIAFFLLAVAPISNPVVAVANVLLFGFGQGIGLWPLQRIWSVELFPTEIRNTAQGFLWSIMRLILGFWSLFLPIFTQTGFTGVAIILGLMFVYNFVVGGFFGPRTSGQTLEAISAEA